MSPSCLDGLTSHFHAQRLGIAALFLSALISVSCSSVYNGANSTAPLPTSHNQLTISPSNAILVSGAKQQFTATVSNTSNSAVTWRASSGTITPTGLFTAPAVTANTRVTVSATSIEEARLPDDIRAAVSIVTIEPNQPLQITTKQMPPAVVGTPYSLTFTASGGLTPYRWSLQGSLPPGLSWEAASGTFSGTPNKSGSFPVTVTVTDATSKSASQSLSLSAARPYSTSGNYDGPAELPRVYIQSTLADTPAPGNVISVAAGGDLQAALNKANCGDTVELQAGASFTGAFVLRAKPCDDLHWIIIRSSAADSALPAEGTRMTPCYAGVASLPGRPSFDCSAPSRSLSQIMGKPNTPPISLDSGANHYRVIGLEVTRPVGAGLTETLVVATTTADHIIFDRLWFHGTAQDETTRGIYLDGITNAAIVDSYFNDFHCTSVTGGCTDSQAIAGGNGNYPTGPYKIVNNFLEAAAESILFGGGGATTSIPADIEIRHNHLFKPMSWMPGEAGFVGGASGHGFIVKNHFELKNAVRVLFEGNVLENTWGGFSQDGYSIVLTPRSHVSSTGVNQCPTCQVTDVTIRYNTISHVGAGLQIGNPLDGAANLQSLAGERYSIHDITVDDINSSKYTGHGTLAMVLNTWTANVLNSVSINHITGFPDLHVLFLLNSTNNPKMWDISFTNSAVTTGRYPVWSAGGGSANCAASDKPIVSLATCGIAFTNNALIAAPPAFGSSTWPSGNLFPANATTVGFVNFNNGDGGDYLLLSTSPYINAGTDGKALGADIAAINSAIAGAY